MDEELLERVTHRIYEHRRGDVNYIKLKSLVRRFLEYNPDGDVESIDWMAVYDDSLEYDELIQAFEEQYPMFRWRKEAPMERGEYEDRKIDFILKQVEDLSEDSLKSLIDVLEEMVGKPSEEPSIVTQATAPATVPDVETVETPVKIVVNIQLLARYPWLSEAKDFLKAFSINNIPNKVVQRARGRIFEALERGELGVIPRLEDHLVELLSFPTTKAMVATINDDWLKRRWSLAESARCERLLLSEPPHLFDYLLDRLELRVQRSNKEYGVRFNDYLKTAGELLRDPSWKLVNQKLDKGWVYLTKTRLTRIIRQHLYRNLYNSFEVTPRLSKTPENLATIMAEIVGKLQEIKARHKPIKPTGRIPPCIEAIRQRLTDASHTENFTYAAYLLNRGHTVDEVIKEFSVRSDYREEIARYHVEHIAGLRGSRTKYRPPNCQTMKTLGLCIRNGELCPKNIRNPLEF